MEFSHNLIDSLDPPQFVGGLRGAGRYTAAPFLSDFPPARSSDDYLGAGSNLGHG